VAPTIAGTEAGQAVTPGNVLDPFASVTISDANANPSDAVTITLKNAGGTATDANGTLTGTGLTETAPGVYMLAAGAPGAITTELDALTFHPTGLAAGVASNTTTFALSVTDPTVGKTATPDSTTSVVESAKTPFPINKYNIVDDNGAPFLENAQNGQGQIASDDVMQFQDGTALFDPTGTAENVSRLYQAALGRAPDAAGLQAWTGLIDGSSVPLADVATDFTTSPEFMHDYGALTDPQYVTQLYQNVLGRAPDPEGAAAWDNALADGESRGSVLVGFAESQENKADTISSAGDQDNGEVYRLYQTTLDRAPDTAGLNSWSEALGSGTPLTQIAQNFMNSTEFQQKYGGLSASDFVSTLYENALGRAADPAGLQAWTNILQQGGSEASVVIGFSDSLENRLNTAAATHANWVFIPT
jgi:hypothetical protein